MSDPIEKPEVDPNPITEVRRKVDGALVIEQTPQKPVTRTTSYNIAELEAKIAKYEGVISLWQAKINPLQAIVEEYNAL